MSAAVPILCSTSVGNVRYYCSDLFCYEQSKDRRGPGRVGGVLILQMKERRFMRWIYRSNSQALFRICPVMYGGQYWKGYGEEFLNLPWQVQLFLNEKVTSGSFRVDMSEQAVRDIRDAVLSPTSPRALPRRRDSRGVLEEEWRVLNPDNATRLVHHSHRNYWELRPEEHQLHPLLPVGMLPDYSRVSVSYEIHGTILERLLVFIVPSRDSSLDYSFIVNAKTGHVYLGDVQSSSGEITQWGLRRPMVHPGGSVAPLVEYWEQSNEKYKREKIDNNYCYQWSYVSRLPLVASFLSHRKVKELYEKLGIEEPMRAVDRYRTARPITLDRMLKGRR